MFDDIKRLLLFFFFRCDNGVVFFFFKNPLLEIYIELFMEEIQ